MKRYTEEHEWIELSGGIATVGITEHAAEELGDITFVELPDTGSTFSQGDVICVIESVKAAADIFAPIAGTVTAVHAELEEKPEIINESAESDGWICKLADVSQDEFQSLMTHDEYLAFLLEDED